MKMFSFVQIWNVLLAQANDRPRDEDSSPANADTLPTLLLKPTIDYNVSKPLSSVWLIKCYTVEAIIIWSLADFVGCPLTKNGTESF